MAVGILGAHIRSLSISNDLGGVVKPFKVLLLGAVVITLIVKQWSIRYCYMDNSGCAPLHRRGMFSNAQFTSSNTCVQPCKCRNFSSIFSVLVCVSGLSTSQQT